jgi:AraC-like DNA-binding protein
MRQNHTISIIFVKTILDCISNDEHETEKLLMLAGVKLALLKKPQSRITPIQFSKLIKVISTTYKDEFLGLSKEPMPLGSFLLLARNVIHCNNLFEVYKNTEMALTAMTKQLSLKLIIEPTQASVHFQVQSLDQNSEIILTELAMLIWHRFPSWLLGKEIPLSQVCLPYGKTTHISEYLLMFSTDNITFNCETAKLVFPIQYLDSPCKRSPMALKKYIEQLPEYWFKRVQLADTSSIVSNECLKLMAISSDISMVSIAQKMNKSVRTLRRNLSVEKRSFNQLKAQFLRDKAIHLLTETTSSIETIAYRLGYTEAATFSRVFKQWTGSTPREYRNYTE